MKKILLLLFLLSSFVFANAQCWKVIADGYDHTLAIKTDGTLWAWGINSDGELGDGTFTNKLYPEQIGNSKDWKSISSGADHSLAIKTDGTLWAWGSNTNGQLGDSVYSMSNEPVQIGLSKDWKYISSGSEYSSAIKTDGTLWTWGSNFYYQLGDGTRITRKVPMQVGTDTKWYQIASNTIFTMALKTNGTIWEWGANNYGVFGITLDSAYTPPIQTGTDNNWKEISEGYNFCLAIKTDSTLWGWGDNEEGQLGLGELIGSPVFTPTEIASDLKWKSFSAGSSSSFAIKTDGTLWAWGYNDGGQLGIGDPNSFPSARIYTPTRIGIDNDWKSVLSWYNTSSAIKTDGTLWAWGANGGSVGNGSDTSVYAPVQIQCTNLLPVILTSFTAQKQHETILLTWQTATEQNNKEYQIERGSDGNTFNKIGSVASNNSSSGSHYSYIDQHPLTGNNYYRLKSMDIDGKFSYSNTDKVTFNLNANNVIVYPNPAKDILTVQSNFKGEKLNISITDLAGRKILQTVKHNNQLIEIPTSDLRAGFYLLKINDGISSVSKKIIKD